MYVLLMQVGIGFSCFLLGICFYYIYHWNLTRCQTRQFDELYYNSISVEEN